MALKLEKLNILLVDDKPENLLALESLLKGPDMEFHRATSGVHALELLLSNEYALAILDVQMPEMDGYELAELMRGTEQTRSVPIIFVTAGAHNRINVFRGYEKGAVDFLHKPLDSHVVKSKVQIFIELARQRQLLRLQLLQTQQALTERDQALVEVREAVRVRDEFMSIASHELKTPFTSLRLQLELMQRMVRKRREAGDTDPSIARMESGFDVCNRQAAKLIDLLNELLDLTRVRLGKLQLTRENLDLDGATRDVVDRFRAEAQRAGSRIDLVSPGPIIGSWDSTRLEQVISNLVSNAIKYGKGSPIKVTLETDEEHGRACITVEDQGMGIPPEMHRKIFERFERAVTGNQITGLGLGLYISRQIVQAHGGLISVKSEEGKGTLFTVDLPLREPEPETAPVSEGLRTVGGAAAEKKKQA